ncbi:hypothetical protein M5D96_008864 [Drosophila gunungcola]|uniref:Uncharacterized protein n=1 Tax=Drosophila gunungcola TaxID=103775 RepID=A0A9P9YK48_9MUSC|nr:hypothetical protein M5D96_008864 [Drosophila gunungcola]
MSDEPREELDKMPVGNLNSLFMLNILHKLLQSLPTPLSLKLVAIWTSRTLFTMLMACGVGWCLIYIQVI